MGEITKDTGSSKNSTGRTVWFLFILLVLFTYFFGLTIPLVGPDEPRYAQVAREMFARNDWITPTLGGFNWFEKPALLYWLEIASYKVFGVSEFSARFGSAIFGLGTIVSLWLLGRGIETEVEDQYPAGLAKWIVYIAASTIGIIVFARGASFDIVLTFPMTAALVGFFIADRSETRSLTSYYLPLAAFYFFIGLALLAKGLIGIVFPFAIVVFYFLLSWRLPSKQFIVSLFWGLPLALAVASIWYVPMYWRYGYAFIDEFFIQHHFQRYTSNKYQHPQPFYFFLWVLPLMTIPWLPFFLAAIWNFGKDTVKRVSVSSRPFSSSPLLLFSFAWMIVPLAFFSFSGSKLPGYILPAVPAAIILTAEFVSRFVAKRPPWNLPLIGLAFSTLIAACLLVQLVAPAFADEDSVRSLITAAEPDYKIFSLHTISHNAEFYGAGRIIRTDDGKQRRFNSVPEVVEEMKREGLHEALVLMPIAYIKEMPVYHQIQATPIGDNGELAIAKFELPAS